MLCIAITLMALPSNLWAQKPSLQTLFDAPATRATGEVIVVDLSEWQTEYDEGLTIANGRRYRFTNGILSRTTKLTDEPLIHISQGSEVEIAPGATISGGNFYTTYPVAIIQVDDGALLVTGGTISGNQNSAGQHGVGVNLYQQAGGLFHITAGTITDIVSNQVANNENTLIVDGGKLSWVATCNGLQLNGNASLSTVSMAQANDAIRLTSALTHTLNVQLSSDAAAAGNCIMRGEAGYQLTLFDVDKLNVTGQGDLFLSLEGNAVYLRAPAVEQPYDLQAVIDSIAASPNPGTEDAPVKLALPEEEVLIKKQIKVWNTYVHLTGGRLKLDEAFATSGDSIVFLVGGPIGSLPGTGLQYGPAGGLTLSNIHFDLNNIAPRYAVFCNWDSLSIAQNVEYENINYATGAAGGFYVNQSALISIASGKVSVSGNALHNGGTAHISGGSLFGRVAVSAFIGNTRYVSETGAWSTHVTVTGGTLSGSGYVFGMLGGGHAWTSISMTGGQISSTTLTSEGSGSVTVTGGSLGIMQLNNLYYGPFILYIDKINYYIGGNVALNIRYNYPIYALSAITTDWRLYWDNSVVGLNSDYVWKFFPSCDAYQLQASDFEHIKFEHVPDSINIYFDEEQHAICAKKLTNRRSLQDLFDQQDPNEGGTEEDPTKLNPGDVDIDDGDVDVKPDLHLLFDGSFDDGTETGGRHRWDFRGGNLNIRPGASVEFRNIDLRGFDTSHHIYVEGTLIIDINVYITGFQRFVYVREGGRVIWRGGTASVSEAGIWNEGGTVEMRGGTIKSDTGRGYVNMRGTILIYDGHLMGSLCAGHNMAEGIIYFLGGDAIGGLHNHGEMHLSGTTVTGTVSPGEDYEGRYTIVNYRDGHLTIDNGTVLGENGTGSIWSETDFTLGDVHAADIYITRTVRIYVTAMWKNIIRIHFFADGDFLADHQFFVGANGFRLPADFLEWIDIQLDERWRLVCDEGLNAVVVVSADAIGDINNDALNALNALIDVYAADGTLVCTGNAEAARTYVTTHKGAFILRQGQRRWKVSR